MKKILSIVLMFVLMLSIVACSEVTEKSADTKKTKDVVEISWLTFETPNITSQVYEKIISRFEEQNPNIKIKRDLAPTDRESYVRTMFATEQLQDVILGSYTLPSVKGALLPFEEETVNLLKDEAVFRIDGNVLMIPWAKQYTPNMYYNKDMFKKYGLEVPKTWDEFINVCEVLKANGEVPIVGGGPDRPFLTGAMPNYQLLTDALHKYSKDYLKLFESGELKWTDAPIKDMFIKWRELIDEGYFHEGSYDFTMSQMVSEFAKGSAAMVCNGSWMSSDKALDDANFNIGWFVIPSTTGKELEYVQVAYSAPLTIYSKTEHPEEAQKFVRFLLSDEEAYSTFLAADQSSCTTKKEITADLNDIAKMIVEEGNKYTPIDDGTVGEHALPSSIMFTEIRNASRNIFVGADIDEELKKLQATYEKIIKTQR